MSSRRDGLSIIRTLAWTAAYFAAGRFSLWMASTGGGYSSPFWPPTGIAVAAVLLGGGRRVVPLWFAAVAVNFTVSATPSFENALSSAIIATGNMLEALTVTWILRGRFNVARPFNGQADTQAFITAIIVGPVISATIGNLALMYVNHTLVAGNFFESWVTWWIGDTLGGLVFVPLPLAFVSRKRSPILRVPAPEAPYLLGMVAFMIAFSSFSGLPAAQPLASGFIVYATLLWCALRLSQRLLYPLVAVLSAVMVVAAFKGWGPFNIMDQPFERLFLLQFFLGCGIVTAMLLSALVSEQIKAVELARYREAAIVQAGKMAALGQMAGGIAHEVLNPLTIIAGKSALLHELAGHRELNQAEIKAALAKIDSTSERIRKIVLGLLAFARNSEGDAYERADLSKILRDTLDFCVQRFERSGVSLTIEGETGGMRVLCSPVQISQVLLNLLNNAYDAVSALPTDCDRWVKVSVTEVAGKVEIAVTDSGPGVPVELRQRIFEPFFTTKEVGRGTGLGLSVSSGIVAQHQGALALDSTSEHTRFVVTLPLAALA